MKKVLLAVLVAMFASTALMGCRAEIEGTDHANIALPR